ncbi:hypothetical protein [Kitasatospora aureofaciens]|uniref:hypothetical protein n=1 Tax=Kitasatospora aureofaciens TaxID=1894 RepID=UPI0037C6D17A
MLVPPAELVAGLRELLVALPVADLSVEEAGLDEAFLDLYRQDVEAAEVRS